MSRKLVNRVFAALFVAFSLAFVASELDRPTPANAASITLLSGPNDPSQGQVTLNQLIQSINSGTAGLVNSQYTATGNGADTTEDTLATFSLPANFLARNGMGVRIQCWGTVANNADVKNARTYFGGQVINTSITASTANVWRNELIVIRQSATAVQVFGTGQQGAAVIAPFFNADTTDVPTSAQVVKCTGQAGTANASDVVMQGFTIEVIQ